MRPDGRGGWSLVDPFFDAGLWYANEAIEAGVPLPFEPAPDDAGRLPARRLGGDVSAARHRDGTLDPEQETAIEALPGWQLVTRSPAPAIPAPDRAVRGCGIAPDRRAARGSRFVLCERSRTDPRFPRYPPLPVLRCAGFERGGGSHRSRPDA